MIRGCSCDSSDLEIRICVVKGLRTKNRGNLLIVGCQREVMMSLNLFGTSGIGGAALPCVPACNAHGVVARAVGESQGAGQNVAESAHYQ